MSTFINLNFKGGTRKKIITKHVLFSMLWILFFAICIFRVDSYFFGKFQISNHLLQMVVPFLFYAFLLFVVIKQKWYYTLALIIYPLLVTFWFLPKLILEYGKFYALLFYLEGIYHKLKNFKRLLTHFIITAICVTAFLFTNNEGIRLLTMVVFTYFFLRLLITYATKSFQPVQIFGATLDSYKVKQIPVTPEKLIDALEAVKDDEKYNEEEKKHKKLERLILVNFCLGYLSSRLGSFRGKRAYRQFAIIQWVWCILAAVLFFTFLNYQLFKIDPTNFWYSGAPNVFDFFYYSCKNITFSNPDYLKPTSEFARLIEIMAFVVFSLFLFIVVASHLITLRTEKAEEGLKIAAENFKMQSAAIEVHVSQSYNRNISQVIQEVASIKCSLDNLGRLLDRII